MHDTSLLAGLVAEKFQEAGKAVLCRAQAERFLAVHGESVRSDFFAERPLVTVRPVRALEVVR